MFDKFWALFRKKTINKIKITTDKEKIPNKEKETIKPTFHKEKKSKQIVPLTNAGFDDYIIKEKENKITKEKEIDISHAGGPITGSMRQLKQSVLGQNPSYDDNVISHWIPHMNLSVADEDSGAALTAAQITRKYNQGNNWTPHYFVNPMQDLDYIVIEAMLKNTFVGSLMNAFTKFLVGTGFRPELQLINPNKENDENDIKEIKANQEIINNLMEIDRQIDTNISGKQDISFMEKIAALIDTTNSFNRSALIFTYDRKIKIGGKTYNEIPSGLKFGHARDLGIIEVTPDTWKMEAVQWRQAYHMIPSTDMIYLWNSLISAKYHNAWFYGGSMVLPMLDATRVIRKIIGVDFPAMAEATWAGMFILAVKPHGQTTAKKRSEYASIASNLVRGGPNILMEDPKDLSFNSVDFTPKVTEFKDLTDFLVRYCVATLGLPQTMFFDESTSNRATMIGKIQLAISTVINPLREQFGRQICSQWYQRWFELIYKDKPEILKKFRIKMVWDDLHIETWIDKIEAANELDARRQLTDEAYGELVGIENYQNKVDENSQVTPGGNGKKMKVGDGEGGSLEIKQKKGDRL